VAAGTDHRRTVAWLDCRTEQQVDAGDHLILVGRVIDFQHSTQTPLGFCRGNYLRFGLEQQAITATPTNAIRVGAILEKDECVLLLKDGATDRWTLPVAGSLGRTPTEPGSLNALLERLGVEAQIGILFAVFDDEKPARFPCSIAARSPASRTGAQARRDSSRYPRSPGSSCRIRHAVDAAALCQRAQRRPLRHLCRHVGSGHGEGTRPRDVRYTAGGNWWS
jgi:hypothetical protein